MEWPECQLFVCLQIKCFSVKALMITPITPEEICELDTFTLQQKIQLLENHPDKAFFVNIIKIAKLELIDRLQIQEFGRMLANDEYKIDFQIKLPDIKQTKTNFIKNAPSQINRKQYAAKMQLNLIATGSYVMVGKPAVNHRYKPKSKKIEAPEKVKTFLRAKKCSYSLPKNKPINSNKQFADEAKKSNLVKEICQSNKKKIIETQAITTPIPQIINTNEEYSLKQKLKRQVKQMGSIFCENDAYDDMICIKMAPLNLKEEEVKILEEEQNKVEVKNEKSQQLVENGQEINSIHTISVTSEIKEQQRIQGLNQQGQLLQIQLVPNQKIGRTSTVNQTINADILEQVQQKKIEQSISQFTNLQTPKIQQKLKKQQYTEREINSFNVTQRQSVKQSIISTINFDSYKKINSSSTFKNEKSKSVRNMHKRVIPISKNDSDHFELLPQDISSKITKSHHQKTSSIMNISKKDGKQKIENDNNVVSMETSKHISRMTSTKFNTSLYAYHQIIHTFQKLFPHSKNILITLRNVQQNLKLHLDKQINEKGRTAQFVKLNQRDLTFKVITQSQKAKKYSRLFNISLETFHKRGSTMLSRIKNQTDTVSDSEMMFYRVVRTKEEVYDIVNSSFHRTENWYELPHGMELKNSWNLLWTWSKPQIDFQDLLYFQKVNHFIGNKQIARKDLLKKNIQKIQKLNNKMKSYFDIIPETFLLPGENISFIKKFREYGMKDVLNYWILKPVGLSRGRGISLINKLEDVVFSQPIVLQKYIMNPLLVDGYKFDMRIYVLVTSMNPLEAYIYRQGFARLSTERYSTSQQMMENKFIHLTNFSIQRQNISQKKNTFEQEIGGSKISLKMLSQTLMNMGIEWGIIQRQIEDIVLKSLIACMNVIPQNPNCFQLFGYDIFIDSDLKCWLLQVNSSPSLEKQYTLDQIIKQQLVDDIVEVVDPVNYDRARLLEVVERRRREAEGLKSSINTNNNSMQQLDEDLHYVLMGKTLKKYGNRAVHQNFKTVAPSEKYHQIVKTLQHYKIDPIIKSEV